VVIYGIRGIRRKEGLLNRIIERANQVSKDEIKPLEKEKQTKEKELEEVKETIRRFLNSLRDGTKTLKLIEDELEELESRQEELEREVNLFSIRIEEKRRYAVNGVILKKSPSGI
jgi:chromosome segregation ATPase